MDCTLAGISGNRARSAAIAALAVAGLWGCGGGGGGGGSDPESVVISGKVTFDRVPFGTASGSGLIPGQPIASPARQVIVEAIDAGTRTVLASGETDQVGAYSLGVPSSRSLFIRAKAQMLKESGAPSWNLAVRNNMNADALYVLDGTPASSGTTNSTRNLHAASGWDTTSYASTRAAAPFAILDTAFEAKSLVLSAAPSAALPTLNFYWSPDNRGVVGEFCPDTGSIGTSFYVGPGFDDECATPSELPAGIYLLGAFDGGAGDTDEFDQHVIAHEFGHYYEDRFSRSDSIGGSHGPTDRLDPRVAFGEGWGNAFAAMTLNDPLYRDSHSGVAQDSGFDLENGFPAAPRGWFSEMSVGKILWDIFDDDAEPGDDVALGFGPIHAVMTGAQVNTEALTSVFSFATALRSANPSASTAIRDLLSAEGVSGADAFGSNETNDGGDELPIYRTLTLAGPLTDVCSRSTAGSNDRNKLGNNRFLRFDNDVSRVVTIQATGAATSAGTVAATDPDIYVYRRGALVAVGRSAAAGSETIAHLSLDAGTHIHRSA